MADKVTKLAEEIYEYVGGVNNVNKIVNCMTRIRMGVIDGSKVDLDGLRAVDGVMGVVEDETLQIVLGPGTVSKVAQKKWLIWLVWNWEKNVRMAQLWKSPQLVQAGKKMLTPKQKKFMRK